MGDNAANPLPAFGFLTVLEDPLHGFFGGYLLLSPLGRPLEFHCSTPVLPNEAQKILYGASLKPYLLGELIGQTLVAEAKITPQVILTDVKEILELSLLREEPIVFVTASHATPSSNQHVSIAPQFSFDNYQLQGSSNCTWKPERVRDTITPLASYVELTEPFQRIKEAIREAQRISTPQGDNDDESPAAA